MAQYGGDNPWEVSYSKESEKTLDASEAGQAMTDAAKEGGGMLDKATRSFSF